MIRLILDSYALRGTVRKLIVLAKKRLESDYGLMLRQNHSSSRNPTKLGGLDGEGVR